MVRGSVQAAGGSPIRHREVREGATHFVTKKCADDLFLIRPSDEVNRYLLYLLILKAARYGLSVHGFCFLSNHFHLIVTDPRGKLPAFMREFLSESSKAIQVATGVDRPIWSRKRYSATQLLDLDAAERKLVYTVLNPMRAGLTEPREWPGLTSARNEADSVITAERPGEYFSRKRPATVSLRLVSVAVPFEGQAAKVEERVRRSTADAVEQCRARLRDNESDLLGAERVLSTSTDQRGERRVRHLNPRFATKNPALLEAAIQRSREFEAAHATAKERYRAGETGVEFPLGTYGYREVLGVRVSAREDEAA